MIVRWLRLVIAERPWLFWVFIWAVALACIGAGAVIARWVEP